MTKEFADSEVCGISSELLEFPVQVIRCKLAGVVPHPDEHWSQEATDQMLGEYHYSHINYCPSGPSYGQR